MKKILIVLLCSLLVHFGCKKTEEPISFQGRTYAYFKVEDGEAKGYIKEGELTQPELSTYIADRSDFFDPINNKPPIHDTIFFLDDEKAKFNKGAVKSWFYNVKGSTIKYTSDTIIGNYCNRPYRCIIDAFLWKPDSVGVLENYASIPGGAPPLTKSIVHLENTIDGDYITVPILTFKERSYRAGISMVTVNYFDKSYINLLEEHDTIAVKEYKVIFKRIN